MNNDNQTIFQLGDLVTLKGMKKIKEKPIGMIKRKWATQDLEIFWLNEEIAQRYAVKKIIDPKKLEIISKANQ
jgi:hypothetical protein